MEIFAYFEQVFTVSYIKGETTPEVLKRQLISRANLEVEYWSWILQQARVNKGWQPTFIFLLLAYRAAADKLETMWTETISVPCIQHLIVY